MDKVTIYVTDDGIDNDHLENHKMIKMIKLNGYISDTFRLHQDIRQGCSLSPLLLIIAVEFFEKL